MLGIGLGSDKTENNKKRSPALRSLQLIKRIQAYKQLYQYELLMLESRYICE